MPGVHHVGSTGRFAYLDGDGARIELVEYDPDDVETLSEPRTSSTGTPILFLRDPEGNLVEVLDA